MKIDTSTTSNSNSFSHTYTDDGTHKGIAFLAIVSATQNITSPQYNGVSMTSITSQVFFGGYIIYLFYLLSPSTGSHTVSFTGGTNTGAIFVTYNGVQQSGQPDNFSSNSNAGLVDVTTTFSANQNGPWLIGVGGAQASGGIGGMTGHQNDIAFLTASNEGIVFFDSNGPTVLGSQTPEATATLHSGSISMAIIAATIIPVANINGLFLVSD